MKTKTYEPSITYFYSENNLKYGYFLHVPEGITEAKILLWGHGSSRFDVPYEQIAENVIGDIRRIINYCDEQKLIAIMPVLPRNYSSETYPDYKLDAQVMTAEVMIKDLVKGNEFYKRPDLEVIKILSQVKSYLQEHSIRVEDKIIVGGVSAGGSFANRFSLLHPNLVDIAILLISGDYIYPESELEGVKLNYPYGIADLNAISNQEYSLASFQKIKNIIFIGANDTDSKFDALSYELNDNEEVINQYKKVIGANSVERTTKYTDYLKSKGVVVELEVGKDMGHQVNGWVMDFVFTFVKKFRDKVSTPQ